MTEPLDIDAIEDSYLGYDPDYPVFRLIAAVRERDADIAHLRGRLGGKVDTAGLNPAAEEHDGSSPSVGTIDDPTDVMHRAKAIFDELNLAGLPQETWIVARALQTYGDERAREARAAAIEEAALVCDGRSVWAEVQITDDDTRPYAGYSVGCDICAEMIRALTAKPGSSETENHMAADMPAHPTNDIEVTPEMIEAGVAVLRGWISEEARSVEFDREIVSEIFAAIKRAS